MTGAKGWRTTILPPQRTTFSSIRRRQVRVLAFAVNAFSGFCFEGLASCWTSKPLGALIPKGGAYVMLLLKETTFRLPSGLRGASIARQVTVVALALNCYH
jgi:hypothetical protein